MTAFQKAVLAAIGGGALVIALVLAAKPAGATLLAGGGGDDTAARLAALTFGGAPVPGISASGDATVKVQPDIAVLTVGVTTQASTAADAQAALNDRMARVVQKAKDLRIADKDVKTSGYNIAPQYTSGPNQAARISGYQASQTLTVTVRDITAVGRALDGFVQGDAATNVQIRFALEDPKPRQAEARRIAIEEARAKAKAMADAAGVGLGKVLSVSESSAAGPIFDSGVRSVAAAPASVPVGDLDVVVHVTVQFAIG